jgi:hypothetical protein
LQARAQSDEIIWANPVNMSNSLDSTSTDPFLLADPAGVVHLFWAEKVGISPTNQPETLLYSRLSGDVWSNPVDIFFSPLSDGNPVIGYPHAVLDQTGRIHLIWTSEPNFPYYALNYSSAPADHADLVQTWEPKKVLSEDLTGSKYSIHIAYSPPNILHILYSQGAQGEAPLEDRSVAYMRSEDLGATWSEPVTIFTVPVVSWGTSDTRLLFEPPSNLYASWTVWDETGNGYRIYFTRSLDNGLTWEEPVAITEKIEGEYERDWNNLALMGENHIMALWEGGYRAYRYAQYSTDAGQTWTEPVDTFPYLIGDNGYVEFARDSNDTMHAFLAQRVREGSNASSDIEIEALWHSVWEGGDRWRDPTLADIRTDTEHITNPKVVIVNGNKVVVAWYQSQIYDIYTAVGIIQNAPEIPSVPWEQPAPVQIETSEPSVVQSSTVQTQIPLQGTSQIQSQANPTVQPGNNILLSLVPSLVVILFITAILFIRNRNS